MSKKLRELGIPTLPSDLLYSKQHSWVRLKGEIATVGITDFFQLIIGSIFVFELNPDLLGKEFNARDVIDDLHIENPEDFVEIYCPISGEIKEINEDLEEKKIAISEDPYGQGWLFKIKASDLSEEKKDLLTSEEYANFLIDSKLISPDPLDTYFPLFFKRIIEHVNMAQEYFPLLYSGPMTKEYQFDMLQDRTEQWEATEGQINNLKDDLKQLIDRSEPESINVFERKKVFELIQEYFPLKAEIEFVEVKFYEFFNDFLNKLKGFKNNNVILECIELIDNLIDKLEKVYGTELIYGESEVWLERYYDFKDKLK